MAFAIHGHNLEEDIVSGGEYAPDNLFTRTVAGKQGLIHLKKNRSYPAFISLLPFRSSFFLLFLAIPAALVAIPVSFAVGGVFHTVRKPAQAAAQCSVTEGKLGIWMAAF